MMKKIYLGLLSALLGTMFGFSFVNGDIIDPGIRTPEEDGAWHVAENITKPENGGNVYGSLSGDCKSPVICFFSQNIGFDIVYLARRIAVFLICVLLLMIISVSPLYNIFEKLGEKGSKALIPIKNLKCLANLLNTKIFGMIWGGLSILWRFLVSYLVYILPPCITVLDFNGEVRRGSSGDTCGVNNIGYIISYLPAIIIFLIYDYFALISFYRLFRKFGWNKGYAVLGTIFFPIGACVLGFGNFEYQGENLEKKEKDN